MSEESSGPLTRLNALSGGFVSLIATVLLLVLAVGVFGEAAYTLLHNLRDSSNFETAINQSINSALLLLIIGELLVTVTQKANLVRELLDFVVIGITSLVRHALQLVLRPENAANVTIDLLVNSAAILLLIVAFLAVRVIEAKLYPPAAAPPMRENTIE